jgi:hypothetical protein
MKKNMGNSDRGVRIVIALAIAALYYFKVIEGTLAYILLAFAAIFLITSFIGFCPLYSPLKINTSKKKE